jgi:hypothetical protein
VDPKLTILNYIFVAGFFGMANCLYMVVFYKASESIQSQNPFKRYFFRYSIFSSAYFLSFFLTPVLFHPFGAYIKGVIGAPALLMPAECLPLAILFYWLECRNLISAEARRKREREPWWARSQR